MPRSICASRTPTPTTHHPRSRSSRPRACSTRTPTPTCSWAGRQAYAAQIVVLDACLGALVEQLEALPAAESTALMLLSTAGYPLGEHGVLGTSAGGLFAESVAAPWMMALPSSCDAVDRCDALVQPSDLLPTILDLCGVADESQRQRSLLPLTAGRAGHLRDRLIISGRLPDEWAIATSAWYLRHGGERDGAGATQLFAKPDDRWDQNDVAALCPDVVAAMRDHAEEMRQLGGPHSWRPLEDLLQQSHS
ncbi:MAG: sulfatase-like hydrolase/transferase [Pirellulales bacterium]